MRKWMQPLRNQRGAIASTVTTMFSILVASILIYCCIDVYGYISLRQKVVIAVNEEMEVMKAENGFSQVNRQSFDRLLRGQGIDPSKVTITEATPKTVQRGETLVFKAHMDYDIIALKPLGKSLHVPINVQTVGLAHKYIRGA